MNRQNRETLRDELIQRQKEYAETDRHKTQRETDRKKQTDNQREKREEDRERLRERERERERETEGKKVMDNEKKRGRERQTEEERDKQKKMIKPHHQYYIVDRYSYSDLALHHCHRTHLNIRSLNCGPLHKHKNRTQRLKKIDLIYSYQVTLVSFQYMHKQSPK